MRTVFFRIFICYVSRVSLLRVLYIETGEGPYGPRCWDAYSVQRPEAFQVSSFTF
jgi:hypothetical protein